MTPRPTRLLQMLQSTSPLIYSETDSGVAKRLRKLRDQTSSKKANVTPCMTRVKKSHKRTAPKNTGTKLKPDAVTLLNQNSQLKQNDISSMDKQKSRNFDLANSALQKMADAIQNIARAGG